jgi:serine protease Do
VRTSNPARRLAEKGDLEMTRLPGAAALVFASFALAPCVRADVFSLGDGKEIRGSVVKETTDAVFVDVGFTILEVPRKEIVDWKKADAAPSESAAANGDGSDLFHSGSFKEGSIRDLVEKIGEGVVLVATPSASGSGFVVSGEGYVVTNFHVVEGEQEVKVTVFRRTGREFDKHKYDKVRIVALNPFVDLALLKIDDASVAFTSVPLGDSDAVRVGEDVFAIGNPLGLERTVSQGIVSVKNRAFEGLTYIQTTTAINPGNSGGPLFNLRGEVVGVTNMGLLGAEGLNFAIPVAQVKSFIRNRDAFAFDKDNPNTGFRYLAPPRKGTERQPSTSPEARVVPADTNTKH